MASPPRDNEMPVSEEELSERQRVNDVLESMVGELNRADDGDGDDNDDDSVEEGNEDPRVDWLINAATANDVAMDGLWVDDDDDDDEDYYDDADYNEEGG